MDAFCLNTGIPIPSPIAVEARASASHVSAVSREKSTAAAPQKSGGGLSSRFSFMYPLQSLWPGGSKSSRYNGMALDDTVLVENNETTRSVGGDVAEVDRENRNWVLKILHVRSLRREENVKRESPDGGNDEEREGFEVNSVGNDESNDDDEEDCDSCRVDYGDEKDVEFDRESFSKLLKRVSLAEAKLYAQMCYLGNLAYCITKIKPAHLLKYRGLQLVTSSIEKRELASKVENSQASPEDQKIERAFSNEAAEVKEQKNNSQASPEDQKIEAAFSNEAAEVKEQKNNGYRISASAAYEIAASAASYLHSHTRSILPFKSSKNEAAKDFPKGRIGNGEKIDLMDPDVASLMATTDSVTAVVAAKEEVKQAVADDLSSTHSSPCEWFICDDDDQATRYFVIQGSETLASWQANLLFEPVEFEGLGVLVHRGIYEAAKGMYEQMLPEVHSHLKSHGRRATFRFTGHSLGGSLSLLINLMLLIRGEAPLSSLLPVVTFGAPSVMCGGDLLLRKLGLPRSHVQSITMHRDIVPRAFSCNYPNHVAELLKAVNGKFRNLPCLNNQKLLYAPMGELLILQPDEKFSPHHDLLPSGSGLYFLSCPLSDEIDPEKQLRAAQTVFFNSPHPLEILSDRSAYGTGGTIQRDHDMNSYLKSVRSVIRQELIRIRRARREHRRKVWWSVLAPRGMNGSAVVGRSLATINVGQNQFNFAGVFQTGKESLKRFTRLVASQHMHLLVVLLFPARLLLLGVTSSS